MEDNYILMIFIRMSLVVCGIGGIYSKYVAEPGFPLLMESYEIT